jgi:hypothetical protein
MHLKLITLSLSLWLLCSSAALADWNPTFDPNKHIYIDPALQQHPSAPIGFEQQLTRELSRFKSTNYYVVAIQSDQNPKGSLGVAKTNDIIKSWSGLKNFPVDDYALVVWARKQSDPSKGGFGKNVSANLPWAKTLDLKSIFKPFMPQNPRGALVAIVDGIDNSIGALATALAVGKIIAAIVFFSALYYLMGSLGIWKAIDDLRTRKDRATALLLKFKLAAESVSKRLLEVDKENILSFYTNIYPDNLELKTANKSYFELTALCVNLNNIVAAAQSSLDTDSYQDVINRFNSAQQVEITAGSGAYTLEFENVGKLLFSIETRITPLKELICRVEAAKGNVQAPPKPAPAPARPTTSPSPERRTSPSPARPASTPSRTAPPRTQTVISKTVYNDYSSTAYVDRSVRSSSRSKDSDDSPSKSTTSDDWGSNGGDYSDTSDGDDY